jgi:hypothetical protein
MGPWPSLGGFGDEPSERSVESAASLALRNHGKRAGKASIAVRLSMYSRQSLPSGTQHIDPVGALVRHTSVPRLAESQNILEEPARNSLPSGGRLAGSNPHSKVAQVSYVSYTDSRAAHSMALAKATLNTVPV